MSDKISELTKVIAENISYDASGHTPEERCPHCNGVIQKEETYGYWIDHRGMLAQEIVNFLGLGSNMRDVIEEKLGEINVTGNKTKDSKRIAEEILS